MLVELRRACNDVARILGGHRLGFEASGPRVPVSSALRIGGLEGLGFGALRL